jgi:SulP family sulfate permease
VFAIFLFIREQIGDRIVHRKSYGNEVFSKQIRVDKEMQVLTRHGDQTVIFELQGSLFFGTTDQLYTSLEADLKKRKYIILDMRRVHSIDITATHMLEQIKDTLEERDGVLIFCNIPVHLPSGKDMRLYFDHVGLLEQQGSIMVFPELGDALEWSENQILKQASLEYDEVKPLDLHEIELFRGRSEETIAALEASMEERFYKAGEQIFATGDADEDLFLIRRGQVRILLPLGSGHSRHVSTFGKGAFFGEMSFLDKGKRSATAFAFTDTDLYVLSRPKFNDLSDSHKKFAINLLEGLARVLSDRLRYTNIENRRLSE